MPFFALTQSDTKRLYLKSSFHQSHFLPAERIKRERTMLPFYNLQLLRRKEGALSRRIIQSTSIASSRSLDSLSLHNPTKVLRLSSKARLWKEITIHRLPAYQWLLSTTRTQSEVRFIRRQEGISPELESNPGWTVLPSIIRGWSP